MCYLVPGTIYNNRISLLLYRTGRTPGRRPGDYQVQVLVPVVQYAVRNRNFAVPEPDVENYVYQVCRMRTSPLASLSVRYHRETRPVASTWEITEIIRRGIRSLSISKVLSTGGVHAPGRERESPTPKRAYYEEEYW